jgi:hypothetical protein
MGNVVPAIKRFFSSYAQRSLTSIPTNVQIMAWFAYEAYNPNPPTNHDGFNLKTNQPDIKVWVNPMRKIVLFAIRGTDENIVKLSRGADYSDLITDLKLIANSEQQTARYTRANNLVRSFITSSLYRGYKFLATGHSLGGAIVYRLADVYPTSLSGHVFNPGVNRDAIRNTGSVSRRIQTHIIAGDPVSGLLGRALANTIVYTPFYDEVERERFNRLPIQQQLMKLHSMDLFPRL